ncbi:fas-activated serine/threonine kinase isoform X1 [Chiloscyllium plagiosum]|uniref:fas-activated serine/threonine kinase isoform X1 n=2 Tax=Chiloscyllium plagiosum TaxID=36176 RepID=UPI001CB8369B|nr:fas-activated serine/threonine kinase isoform X1 [Chiloscyllium plagiosum]
MQRLPLCCFSSLLPRGESVLLLDGLTCLSLGCILRFLRLACRPAAACLPRSPAAMYAARYHTCKPHIWAAYPEHFPHLYQGRRNGHKPHYHHHPTKKKTWNFIHEKMSYDTFFTMKRLIDRSRTVGEVLRWVTQNPGKISYNHYPIALQKIGQVLQQLPAGSTMAAYYSQMLELEDFQTLCQSIVSDCSKFDNFSIVNCLYAVAALGLPGDSKIVQVLEEESRIRLSQFNQKDISMVFSSVMKLHPSIEHPLIESCLTGLEKNIEKERHPQTLFLLLSYYKLKAQALQSDGYSSEQLLNNRKILRLVKHTLGHVTNVRDHEMTLLDEMLATCARETSNKSLELIFSSQLFYENRQEKFINSLAEELPKKVDSITPYTMALIAKYIARHRLRETRLLDTIADFLIKKGENLDSKIIQKLVFPFSRMNYKPSHEAKFFAKLESVLEVKAMNSPLATVNIFMSMFQLGHFPGSILDKVFSAAFINNVMNSPYGLIVRRYLSLLDAAVELEHSDYKGPRLEDRYKVMMFDRVLTADEVNRKYSYKGLVAEALRQLIGDQCYKQDEVLPPGYYTDFLLWINGSGTVLHINGTIHSAGTSLCPSGSNSKPTENTASIHGQPDIPTLTADFQKFSPFGHDEVIVKEKRDGDLTAEVDFLTRTQPAVSSGRSGSASVLANSTIEYNTYYPPSNYYTSLTKEQSLESQDSSTLSSPSDCLNQVPNTTGCSPVIGSSSLFQFPIEKILDEQTETPSQNQEHNLFRTEQTTPNFYDSPHYPESQSSIGQVDMANTVPPSVNRSSLIEKQRHLEMEQVNRIVMSVNDKWHYCHNSDVLVGSRAMRDRHLRLLGYTILQLPYHELEKLNGIEEVKHYLRKRLLDVQL